MMSRSEKGGVTSFTLIGSPVGSVARIIARFYGGVEIMMIFMFVFLYATSKAQTEGDGGYDYEGNDYEGGDDEGMGGAEPSFDVPIVNVTVIAGQIAMLPCSIDSLGKFKVAWLDQNSMSLTYEDRRIVDDSRFDIVRPFNKEWNLLIRDVRWDDQGSYRCTVNSSPVRSKIIALYVKVPPHIISDLSSDDVIVHEGDVVVLVCNVTGVPRPEVMWYRRPASGKLAERENLGPVGEVLVIQNVSRYCDDYYECVATNGVPPDISRQMRVTVQFAPEVILKTRRLGQQLGRETILECTINAYPHALNYWQDARGKPILSSDRFRVDTYDEGERVITLSLRIDHVTKADYGDYRCVASNSLGQHEQVMTLYEYTEQDVRREESAKRAQQQQLRQQQEQQEVIVEPLRPGGDQGMKDTSTRYKHFSDEESARKSAQNEKSLSSGKKWNSWNSKSSRVSSTYCGHFLAIPFIIIFL